MPPLLHAAVDLENELNPDADAEPVDDPRSPTETEPCQGPIGLSGNDQEGSQRERREKPKIELRKDQNEQQARKQG